MSRAWDELGGSGETYEHALARSLVGQKTAPLSEQELATKAVEAMELTRRHDERFASSFLSLSEQVKISRTLARQLGYPDNGSDGL